MFGQSTRKLKGEKLVSKRVLKTHVLSRELYSVKLSDGIR